MPRPKYPSDHRRWFRVYEDILDDPKLASVELRDVGAFVVLLATLNRQKSRDGKAFISWRSAAALLRCQKRADVERVLGRLGAARVLTYIDSDAGAEYRIPKWAELQGFTPAELRRDSGVTPSPTPTPTPTPIREESSVARPPPDAAPKKVKKPMAVSPEAEAFAAKFVRVLNAAHQDPPIKLPTDSAFAGWQRDAHRMFALDGRSVADADRVAAWLFNDAGQDAAFWRKNVLSVGTFRKQFDRLARAMNAPRNGGRDEFHGSKILRYLATAEAGDSRPRAGGTVQDPEPPILRLAELPAGER